MGSGEQTVGSRARRLFLQTRPAAKINRGAGRSLVCPGIEEAMITLDSGQRNLVVLEMLMRPIQDLCRAERPRTDQKTAVLAWH